MICHFHCCPRLFIHNICWTSDDSADGWHRTWTGICKCCGRNYWSYSLCYVLIRLFFSGLLHSWDLHKKKETVVLENRGISFPCELLLFNYAKVNTVFCSMKPLMFKTNLHWCRVFVQYVIFLVQTYSLLCLLFFSNEYPIFIVFEFFLLIYQKCWSQHERSLPLIQNQC